MRVLRGLDEAKRVLCDGRGLRLDTLPPHMVEKTREVFGESLSPIAVAELILRSVRADGDRAVRDLTRRLDGVELEAMEVPASETAEAYSHVPEPVIEALSLAAERIRRFYEATLPRGWVDFSEGFGELVNPVDSAGVYVPGGTARYPSTVLMTVIPARVAGVAKVIVATPGLGPEQPDPTVLVAADLAGVDSVFQIGGAQAIAAMAYGTETVPRVDMVCGPGNIFVTLAKKLLFGEVGIDGLYGPTETVVLADDAANPTLCAADLLAQAEHDVLAAPILITTSERVATATADEIDLRVGRLERAVIIRASLEHQGCIAIVGDVDEGIELANAFAPEHLCLMVRDPWSHVGKVRNAGAVFLGDYSHEVLGDYVAGPSHVMPTGGTARFGSGVSTRTFLKTTPVVGLDRATAEKLTGAASVIARAEGLTAHAEAAEVREELLSGRSTSC